MTEKTRVLFVCVGNACRSQMAEGFARKYGPDVVSPASAGLAPAVQVAPDTIRAMQEKNISLRDHFPKSLKQLRHFQFDLLVNMSGIELVAPAGAAVRTWPVRDPVAENYDVHCQVRDEIETLVMNLILELRRDRKNQR